MIQNPLEKLIVLAAASGMTVSEFRVALNAMESSSPTQLEDLFRQVRNRLRNLDDPYLQLDRRSERNSVRRDILALLKAADLPPSIAAERIANKIAETTLGQKLPEYSPKEGISRWIDRVARLTGDSALLNAAVAALSPSDPNDKGWTLSRS